MKKLLLILLILPIFTFSQVSINELILNNCISQSKDEIYKLRNKCDLAYPDSLFGKKYDVIKCTTGKILERFFFTNIENQKDTQTCFYYRMILVSTFYPYEKIESILNKNFKKIKNNSWEQILSTYKIIWTLEQKDYIITLNGQKQ